MQHNNWGKDRDLLASLASKVIVESCEDGEDKDAEYLKEGFFADFKKGFNTGKIEALYKDHEDAFIKMIEPHVKSMTTEVFFDLLKQGIKPERQLRLLDKEIQAAIEANGGLENTIKKLGNDTESYLKEGFFADFKKGFNTGKIEALYKDHEDAFIKMIEPHVKGRTTEVFFDFLKQGIMPEKQLERLKDEIEAAIKANGGLTNTIKKLGKNESAEDAEEDGESTELNESYTSNYMTDQQRSDKYTNKSKEQYRTFGEHFNPKTSWQLEEMNKRGYGRY